MLDRGVRKATRVNWRRCAVTLVVCFAVGSLVASVHGEVGEIGLGPNVSEWYVNDFGKFNLAAMSPLSSDGDRPTESEVRCARFYAEPIPHSSYSTALVVECDTRVALLFFDANEALADSLVYENVGVGWYAVLVGARPSMSRLQVRLGEKDAISRDRVFGHK